jgi:hypothetical protein
VARWLWGGASAAVVDFTRECLGLVVDTSLTGLRVMCELDRIANCGANRNRLSL